MSTSGAAVLRFHLSVGARLAMRVLMPAVVAVAGGAFFVGPQELEAFARMLFGAEATGGSAAVLALLCLGAAGTAAPRICRGLDGWLRHLPVAGTTHRRAAAAAIAVAQAPVVLGLLGLALVVALPARRPGLFAVHAAGLPLTALAAALLVMPIGRGLLARPLALAAALLAAGGTWPAVAAGAALLFAADLAAGPLRHPRGTLGGPKAAREDAPRGANWTTDLARRAPPGASGRPKAAHEDAPRGARRATRVEVAIAWRALGWRLASAWALGLLPLGAAALFVRNNELAPHHVRFAALLGGGFAVVVLMAELGESLAVRRPAWPWSRSLPWSARRRVAFDAALLAVHALPLLAATAWLEPVAGLALLALVPPLSARAAGALRRAPERRTGAAGEILLEGLAAAAMVALLPWLALLLLAATPAALAAAAERDRRQKVSRWLEIHHLAAGDPQSWSA